MVFNHAAMNKLIEAHPSFNDPAYTDAFDRKRSCLFLAFPDGQEITPEIYINAQQANVNGHNFNFDIQWLSGQSLQLHFKAITPMRNEYNADTQAIANKGAEIIESIFNDVEDACAAAIQKIEDSYARRYPEVKSTDLGLRLARRRTVRIAAIKAGLKFDRKVIRERCKNFISDINKEKDRRTEEAKHSFDMAVAKYHVALLEELLTQYA